MSSGTQVGSKFDVASLFARKSKTIVMGVINVTPDSFSDGGRYLATSDAVQQALRLEAEGADVIDIGGESSRPGSEPVSEQEELERILPVVEQLTGKLAIPVSIDTWKAPVAAAALAAGCAIVNDITALEGDPEMASVIAEHRAGAILMHKRGTPKEMQLNTEYGNLIEEVDGYLAAAAARAIAAGVAKERIMLDPGIGFGKDVEGNLELVKAVGRFARSGYPILIGASRKGFIGKITGATVENRVAGSVAVAVAAVLYGAVAVRVHDVAATRQAVDIAVRLRLED